MIDILAGILICIMMLLLCVLAFMIYEEEWKS